MRIAAPIASTLLALATQAQAAPEYSGMHQSTPADLQAINQVVENFRTGIIDKDIKRLTSLMLNANILFASPARPEQIKEVHDTLDESFDGLKGSGLRDFCLSLKREKLPVEEKFHDVKITQDDNVAWVTFDYEFQIDHKTQNYGIETWQLMRVAESQWKIISVVWTVHLTPAAG